MNRFWNISFLPMFLFLKKELFFLPMFVPGTLLGTFSKNGEGLGVVVGKSANDGILKLF